MQTTAETLVEAAHIITFCGLHTGEQFADTASDALDNCAAVYLAAEGTCPVEFSTDEDASIRIIEASAPAMAAIKAISEALDSEPCEDEITPGLYVANHLEHVSNWAATASPVPPKRRPTLDEVIGRILRAANTLATQTPAA